MAGYDGHLPSNALERAILFACEGVEDEDGRPTDLGGAFLAETGGPTDVVHRKARCCGLARTPRPAAVCAVSVAAT